MSSVRSKAHAASVITAIIPLPSDPNVRRIKVGSRTVGTLRASDIETLGLHLEQPWTAMLENKVEIAATCCTARKRAMNWLGRRAHSRSELQKKLTVAFDERIARIILEELAADGWIDDAAFASALATELMQRRAASAELVREKLRTKGVESEVIEDTLREIRDAVDPIRTALTFAQKRLATMSRLAPIVARRRLAATLARRGYDDETIHAVLDQIGLRANDSED